VAAWQELVCCTAGGASAGSGALATGLSPADMLQAYSTARGGYNPAPQLPKKVAVPKRLRVGGMTAAFVSALGASAPTLGKELDDGPNLDEVYREARAFAQHVLVSRDARQLRGLLARVKQAYAVSGRSTTNGKKAKNGKPKRIKGGNKSSDGVTN